MNVDVKIRRALDEIATAPEPLDLADRALRAASRRRRFQIITGSGAGVAVLVLAVAGLAQLASAPLAQPGARPATAPCVEYTSGSNGLPEVPRGDWPDFVAAAVASLPDRSDYSMQSGYAWCQYGGGFDGAYAVVNLGQSREGGHLTISVYVDLAQAPRDCAEVSGSLREGATLLFCDEPTGATPLTVGQASDGRVAVSAYYADGPVVDMESYGPDITVEHLRPAVTSPDLYAAIPLAAGTPTGP